MKFIFRSKADQEKREKAYRNRCKAYRREMEWRKEHGGKANGYPLVRQHVWVADEHCYRYEPEENTDG